jgi:hypothetical protein
MEGIILIVFLKLFRRMPLFGNLGIEDFLTFDRG